MAGMDGFGRAACRQSARSTPVARSSSASAKRSHAAPRMPLTPGFRIRRSVRHSMSDCGRLTVVRRDVRGIVAGRWSARALAIHHSVASARKSISSSAARRWTRPPTIAALMRVELRMSASGSASTERGRPACPPIRCAGRQSDRDTRRAPWFAQGMSSGRSACGVPDARRGTMTNVAEEAIVRAAFRRPRQGAAPGSRGGP